LRIDDVGNAKMRNNKRNFFPNRSQFKRNSPGRNKIFTIKKAPFIDQIAATLFYQKIIAIKNVFTNISFYLSPCCFSATIHNRLAASPSANMNEKEIWA
jgi:hypothetical protein